MLEFSREPESLREKGGGGELKGAEAAERARRLLHDAHLIHPASIDIGYRDSHSSVYGGRGLFSFADWPVAVPWGAVAVGPGRSGGIRRRTAWAGRWGGIRASETGKYRYSGLRRDGFCSISKCDMMLR